MSLDRLKLDKVTNRNLIRNGKGVPVDPNMLPKLK